MKRLMMRAGLVVGVALALIQPATAGDNATGTLIVTSTGVENTKGQLIVSVYKDGENWLKPDKAFRVQKVAIKKPGNVTVMFRNLPHGTYAVASLHDQNKNGDIDMRWLPYPRPLEGYGVSNNWTRKGEPEVEKAKFKFDRSVMSLRIKLVR